MNLQILPEPGDEGGYTICAASSGLRISEGDNKEGAFNNIREAIVALSRAC
ncbi:hypothetical protein Metlim_2368 [Methanoplanus limicola DSM 2279]|uniref:HicB family protein n=1 Tax=Methanoplanus limicola DSM 2279 TaxID=937775 RepID=H1Z2L7_9EURY|nr:hypothetical protein Metlim_2368 [Methanoplanus limicola DSM 2279]